MNLSKKHKIIIISVLSLVAVVTVLVGCWIYFYLLPGHLEHNFFPDYLERNQRVFRAGNIGKVRASGIELEEISLGNSAQPLFTAPRALLKFSYLPDKQLKALAFENLELFDCRIDVSVDKNEVRINGIKLADFIRRLDELPPGPDGNLMSLKINARLFMPHRAQPSKLSVEILPEPTAGCYEFTGRWQDALDQTAGSWQAHWNQTDGELTVSLAEAVDIKVLQEILIRSGVPEALAAVAHRGKVTGSGRLAILLPAFKISDVVYSGSIDQGEIKLWDSILTSRKPFAFSLRKDGRRFEWETPVLEVTHPLNLPMQNIMITRAVGSAEVKFSALADLRHLALQLPCRQFGFAGVSRQPFLQQVDGRWNLKSNQWSFQDTVKDDRPSTLQLDCVKKQRLVLTVNEFGLEGRGKGGQGTVESYMRLQNMEFYAQNGTYRIPDGSIRGESKLGEADNITNNSLGFNISKLTADTRELQFEILRPAGEFSFRQLKDGSREFYLAANGGDCAFNAQNKSLNLKSWRCTLNASRPVHSQEWRIAGLKYSTPGLEASYQLNGEKIRLSAQDAVLLGGTVVQSDGQLLSDLKFTAAKAAAGEFSFQLPELALLLDLTKLRRNPAWSAKLKFLQGSWGEDITARNGTVLMSGHNIDRRPEKLDIAADNLRVSYAKWQGDFIKSHWLINNSDDKKSSCKLQFEALRAISPGLIWGRGSFGPSSLDITYQRDEKERIRKLNANYSGRRLDWQYQALLLGGEKIDGAFKYNVDHPDLWQNKFDLTNGTLLGYYFSLMAPRIQSSAVRNSQAAAGDFKFDNGVISSPDGQLELSGCSMVMPWQITMAANVAPPPPGSLTVKKASYRKLELGSFNSQLQHQGHRLSFNGALPVVWMDKAPLKVNGTLALPPQRPGLDLNWTMARGKLTAPLALDVFYPAMTGVSALKGYFALNGNARIQEKQRDVQGSLVMENSDWQLSSAAVEDVNGQINFTDLTKLTAPTPASLAIGRFKWQDWIVSENDVKLSLPRARQLAIANWRGKYQSGNVDLRQPITVDFNGISQTVPMEFYVKSLPLQALLGKLGIVEVETAAAVDGTVKMRYADGNIVFGDSSVSFKSPRGELIKMSALDKYVIRMRDQSYQAFVLAVLHSMRCYTAVFEFDDRDNFRYLKIKADGKPERPVPFVYQGRSADTLFRPAEAGESGFDGELELQINLKLNSKK